MNSTLSLEIQLDGLCVEQISRTYKLADFQKELLPELEHWNLTTPLSSFSSSIGLESNYSITGEDMMKALFRTLNADRGYTSARLASDTKSLRFPWHDLSTSRSVADPWEKRTITKGQLASKFMTRLASFHPRAIRHAKEEASYRVAVQKVYGNLLSSSTQRTVNTTMGSQFFHHLPFGTSYHKDANNFVRISMEARANIILFINNRSFFVTKRGYIGVGPDNTMLGDTVCTIFGSPVPFILRAVEDSEKFRLIGESYVHGIMDGELFKKELWKKTDDGIMITDYGMIEPTAESGLEMRSFTVI